MVLRLSLLLLAGCAAAAPPVDAPLATVEDFESGRARWKDAGSGSRRTDVEIVDGGVAGRRAARITFSGGTDGWTDLTWPVGRWPEGGRAVSVCVRAPKPCRILVKVNLGPSHEDLEMWGRPLDVTTEWREHVVPVAELSQYIFGHRRSAAPDASRILGIGFVELDHPVTFEVDRIGIRR